MNLIHRGKNRAKQLTKEAVNFFKYEKIVDLNQSQWWDYKTLRDFQHKRLKKILTYAYKNIPAYRRKFEQAQVTPKDIHCTEDLHKLPITTREEMQNNPDFANQDLITTTLYTGGSTGSTLKYFESLECEKIRWNTHLRGWRWNGYEYAKKKLAVITSAQGVVRGKNTLNLFGDMNELNIKENLTQTLAFRPPHIRGYVCSLYIMAKYCLDQGIKIDFVESINTISENLYDFQREVIEKAFGGKVFEEYVCNDGGACAWECDAHDGLHYAMERAIIEEIDGEMIVTDLWNKAMPFIRYRNGDSVTFLEKKCSCGRELPLIKVKGRTNDILISRKGPVSPAFIVHHGSGLVGLDKKMKHFRSGIRMIQYVQKPGYKLQINLVKNDWCSEGEIVDFTQNIQEIFGDMEIEILIVDTIPGTAKGKRQFLINEDKELLKKWGYSF